MPSEERSDCCKDSQNEFEDQTLKLKTQVDMARIVVGVSGASGIVLAIKAVSALGELGHDIELVVTKHGFHTAAYELGKEYASPNMFLQKLSEEGRKRVRLHAIQDMGAAICSGSFLTLGMLIIPCSMATVAAVSLGLSDNCLRRAADVTLKEKRPLILVPRESPLSEIHLENMLRLARLGASILPPVPAWYNGMQSMDEIENFIVGKALDLFKIEHTLYKRWA